MKSVICAREIDNRVGLVLLALQMVEDDFARDGVNALVFIAIQPENGNIQFLQELSGIEIDDIRIPDPVRRGGRVISTAVNSPMP